MIKAAIIGATGYAGATLVGILAHHKDVELSYLASHSYAGKSFSSVYPGAKGLVDQTLMEDDVEEAAKCSDVIFLALPAGLASKAVTPSILEKCVVIDLGADFRLKDKDVYSSWYKCEHHHPELLKEAVYGLCEINREKIKSARLIANPGCYTTCSILTLYPLLKEGLIEKDDIIIDAGSGVSGAGRSEKLASLFCECGQSYKAYGVGNHRHTPEIEEQLSYAASAPLRLVFTPHLVPMDRGILATCYAKVKPGVDDDQIAVAYAKYYGQERFVRLRKELPETRFVRGTNLIDISFVLDRRTGRVIALGAIDNLIKGAAGQAVQNMNIAFGFAQDEALDCITMQVM